MSETQDSGRCWACARRREASELLVVEPLDGRRAFLVCRPSVQPECFGLVGDALRYRIRPATTGDTT